MAVRPTMITLIERVRVLCGVTSQFRTLVSDQQVQDALDRTRVEMRYMPLDAAPSIQPGGAIKYYIFTSVWDDWEAGAVIQSGAGWLTLTPSESDWQIGRWTFADHITSTVYITGRTYDRYAAAATVLEESMLPQELMNFDFSGPGGSFQRNMLKQNWRDQMTAYRRQARPVLIQQISGESGYGA